MCFSQFKQGRESTTAMTSFNRIQTESWEMLNSRKILTLCELNAWHPSVKVFETNAGVITAAGDLVLPLSRGTETETGNVFDFLSHSRPNWIKFQCKVCHKICSYIMCMFLFCSRDQ